MRKPKMIKFGERGREGILAWLKGKNACPTLNGRYSIGDDTSYGCWICHEVLGVSKFLDEDIRCPCFHFNTRNIDFVLLALDLLEYNNFEIPGNPEDYARLR